MTPFELTYLVLEHVEHDDRFVDEVHRVLKRDGVFGLTTPNGQAVENTNPDYKRHYTREQRRALLAARFRDVRVEGGIRGGRFHRWSLKSWPVKRPFRTGLSKTHHLIAEARKAG